MVAPALLKRPEIPRAGKPDFPAVDRKDFDYMIADRDLFAGEQEHAGYLSPVHRSWR